MRTFSDKNHRDSSRMVGTYIANAKLDASHSAREFFIVGLTQPTLLRTLGSHCVTDAAMDHPTQESIQTRIGERR